MAKLKMKNIQIAAIKSDRKKLMALLQRRGVVEIKSPVITAGFVCEDTTPQKLTFERMVQSATQALEVLEFNAPEKKSMLSSLNGRRIIDDDIYYEYAAKSKNTIKVCYDLVALDKQISECRAEISRITMALDEMQPWMTLDVPTGFKGTKSTRAFIGTFADELTAEQIKENVAGAGYEGAFELEIVSSSKLQTCIFAVCMKSDAEAFEKALRSFGFASVSNPDKKMMCVDKAKYLITRRSALDADCGLIIGLIRNFAELRNEIEFFIDFYSMRVDRYDAYSRMLQSRNAVYITGYIPEKFAASLTEEIEQYFTAAVEISDPAEDEDVPVMLSNNSFNEPCESIVEMYSMPSKTDVDPTSFMAIFFYIFFGLMLSDAGYGLIIVLACFIALKKFTLEDSMKNNLKLFLYSGISTVFWGIMFGGFFGDSLKQVTGNFFGNPIVLKPVWIDPLQEPLTLLIFGIVLGVIHIFVGMGINFFNLCKQGKVWDAIFDIGLWYVTLIGAFCLLGAMAASIPMLGTVGKWMMIVGAVGLVLTQGRNSKGFGKVISGVASLYSITSYASDILSYSRLMALGLATGVLAQVVNMLGTMNKGIFGVLMFIVVFLIGTAISFAMNALGAYVHTIRLQYVEYFSKFYDGGGRAFKPFTWRTKFIRFKKQDKK